VLRLLNRIRKDRRGVASLELALVVPLMVILLIGIYQVAQLVRLNMKVSSVATEMADLVAQQTSTVTGGTSGVLGNFCVAAKLAMTPFATGTTGPFSLAIASVTNSSSGVAVDWESDGSCTVAASAMGSNAVTLVTSPTNLLPNTNDSVIVVQATYKYSSVVQYLAPGVLTITKTAFARPRTNATIPCTAPCT